MAFYKHKVFWAVASAIVLLAALIYGAQIFWLIKYGSSSQPIPSTILDVDKHFNHFPSNFPPDPGDAGRQTIEGIDADHDGVRDDVQRWIYAYVPNEPPKQMALRQMARVYQQYDLAEDFTPNLIAQAMEPLDRAVQCLHKSFDGRNGYFEEIYLRAKVLNTFSRVKRFWDNNAKVTTKEMSGAYLQYESPCDNR